MSEIQKLSILPASHLSDVPGRSLSPYLVSGTRIRSGVLVCPGGGYGHLAVDHEGHQTCQWFNSLGIHAYLLRYKVAPPVGVHPEPLQDAIEAMEWIRAHSDENLQTPDCVGVIGYSAGGHLAASLSTLYKGNHSPAEARASASRPDFSILLYPIISLLHFPHSGSKHNLLGDNPSVELVEQMSPECQVNKDTPPAFLFHGQDDTGVPAENSVLYWQALQRAGVSAELHVVENGPHGFGIRPSCALSRQWPQLCENWLRHRGVIN